MINLMQLRVKYEYVVFAEQAPSVLCHFEFFESAFHRMLLFLSTYVYLGTNDSITKSFNWTSETSEMALRSVETTNTEHENG